MMLTTKKNGFTLVELLVVIATDKSPLGDASGGASPENMGDEEDPDASPKRSRNEKVPTCYNDRSQLKVEVTAGDSSLDFDLKSDCSTSAAT